PSRIPNAGLGVFLRRRSNNNPLPAGTIVALYPGTLYRPGEAIFFTSLQNRYILKCEDGIFVDGKPTGLSGFIYRSANGRDNFPGIVPTADTTWMVDWSTQVASLSTSPSLSSSSSLPSASSTSKDENNNSTGLSGVEGGREGGQRQQEGIDTSGMLKNPLAVGQIVNNGTSQFPPNVRYQELDIQTRDCPLELQEFLPNIWYSGDWHSYDHEHDEQQQDGEKRKEGETENERERRNMDRIPGSGGLDRLRTVVLVTTRPIEKDEELYSTYIE
ncbi:SET domain-containing protein 9, partial [Mortierella sp. AD031]